MGEHGSPTARFRRALKGNSALTIRTMALECDRLNLDSQLQICLAFRRVDPKSYDPSCGRWMELFLAEVKPNLALIERMVVALRAAETGDNDQLHELCIGLNLRDSRRDLEDDPIPRE